MILIIATVGQIFCGAAGLTSASRTWYAFSRDRAMPGWAVFRRVNRDRVPLNAVIAVSVFSLADHDPGAVRQKRDFPFAFFAAHRDLHGRASTSPTSSRCTCGCGAGDAFEPGPWTWAAATGS